MNRFIAHLSAASFLLRASVSKALALEPPPQIPGIPGSTATDSDSFIQILVDIIAFVLDFVLILAVIFVIIAGLRLIVSGGDEGEKDKAKKTIIYVIVGIIVVLVARILVTFVDSIFTEALA